MSLATLSPARFYREAFLAVTDFSFYRGVFQQSLSRSLTYLLYLVLNASLFLTIVYGWTFLPSMERFLLWAGDNFPPLEISRGTLSIGAEQPLVVKYLADQIYTFVFDTTDQHEPLYKLSQPAFVFTEENLFMLVDDQTQTWSWKSLPSMKVDRQVWVEWTDSVRWVFFPVVFLGLLFFSLIGKSVQALLLTFFAMSAAARQGVRLPFANYLTIAFYGLTPAVAIDLIVALTGQEVFFFGLIYLVTAAIYTYRAAQKCVLIE